MTLPDAIETVLTMARRCDDDETLPGADTRIEALQMVQDWAYREWQASKSTDGRKPIAH
jgi:hypothetical protein